MKDSLSNPQSMFLQDCDVHFRDFIDNISDWIWEVDREGRYIYSNRKVLDILGYTPDEILGRTPFDFMRPEESARVKNIFSKIIESQAPFSNLENVGIHKNGHPVILETSGVPYYDPSGHFSGFRGIDRDVTERRRLASQLKKTRKLNALSTLAGGIAHEFNNALHVLAGHIEMLELDFRDNLRFKEFKQETRKSVTRLADLSNQLLAYARCGKYNARNLNLNDIINKKIAYSEQFSPAPGIRIVRSLDESLPAIHADTAQLSMVLNAVLMNAVEAIQKKGKIHITTSVKAVSSEMALDYPGLLPGDYVSITIEDTGIGMDEETLTRVFEPFFTTKFQGRGLGMAAAYGIIKNHNGYIYLTSKPGNGTTALILFPMAA